MLMEGEKEMPPLPENDNKDDDDDGNRPVNWVMAIMVFIFVSSGFLYWRSVLVALLGDNPHITIVPLVLATFETTMVVCNLRAVTRK